MSACSWIVVFAVSRLAANVAPSLPEVDFKARFGNFNGCFVLHDLKGGWTLRYNDAGCAERLSPCSTFKIFSALVGLDTGVLADGETLFKWDGSPQHFKSWEKDHTLATAIRDSVVWYFREVAGRVGLKRMQEYVDRCDYGNRDLSGGLREFWIGSSFLVSADEQVHFLTRLQEGGLPFKKRSMDIVKQLIVYRQSEAFTVSGKTGSNAKDGKGILGWYVGHVRSGTREFIFAMNIRAADGASGPVARELVLKILADMKLIGAQ